jgi:hypothetical protein
MLLKYCRMIALARVIRYSCLKLAGFIRQVDNNGL